MYQKFLDLAKKLGDQLATYTPTPSLPTKTPVKTDGFVTLQIRPFRQNAFGIGHWHDFLTSFSGIKNDLTFFLIWNKEDIKMYVSLPLSLKIYFENAFYAVFPNSELLDAPHISAPGLYGYVSVKTPVFYQDSDFKKDGSYLDPFKDVLSAFYNVDRSSQISLSFQMNLAPSTSLWKTILSKLKTAEVEDKAKTPELKRPAQVAIGYRVSDKLLDLSTKSYLKDSFKKFLKEGKVSIVKSKTLIDVQYSELVNIFHLPTSEVAIKNLDYLTYRKLPFPPNLPKLENSEKNDVTLLAYTDYKTDNFKFGIKNEDKFRHVYVVGKTWMGKSTLISNMARSDMVTNKWVAILDPHGDLIDTLLEHVPSRRTNDVILFDVSDFNYPIWFNILQYKTEEEKNLVVSWVVWSFKKLYGESRWPRLEYILRNVLLAIIEYPNATLMHLNRMLVDKNFREDVLEYVKDEVVLKFWRAEFDKRTDKFRDEAIAPITNKVWQFFSSPVVRNIFWQSQSKLNIREIMDEWKILLINLSKWKIWEDNAAMIWSFLVTKFQIDAMSRADTSFDQRRDFFLYIDEFQNFATDSFKDILSEARKFKLWLTVANQYISQIEDNVKNAIFGNVWTIISFGLGYDDAAVMTNQFKEVISANDLLSLPKFKAYIKLMHDGFTTEPFLMSALPLPKPESGDDVKEKVRKQTRQRYAMEKEQLEKLLQVWWGKTFSPVEKVMEKAKAEAKEQAAANKQQAAGGRDWLYQSKVTEEKQQEAGNRDQSTEDNKQQIENIWQEMDRDVSQKHLNNSIPLTQQQVVENIWSDNKESEESTISETENIYQTEESKPETVIENSPVIKETQEEEQEFSINDIVIWKEYDGYVKLKYNYGLFVTVMWVEGLLHKKALIVPDGIRWKDLYNIWDKIKVKAIDFKEVEGVRRVVWSQI